MYEGHKNDLVKFILSSEFIFSLAEEGDFIIFNIKTGGIVRRKKFEKDFRILIHPTTYVNKLLFADDNSIELWNIIDDDLVYKFENALKDAKGKITNIVQSPVIHTVAVGFSDGEIRLVNL